MAITSYLNGAGGTTGARLATLKRLNTSGVIRYVGNATTGASDANSGVNREAPLLTTAQAYANSSAGDTIVYLANHNETISVSVTLGKAALTLVGEGEGLSIPRFTCGATIHMFDVTAANILFDTLYFPASSAVPSSRIRLGANHPRMSNLQFECGANDTAAAMSIVTGASEVSLFDSTFTSTASTAASAISVANALTGLIMDNVVLDGGSFGWTSDAFACAAAITRMRATRMYQFNGSDVGLATGTTGIWQQEAATGDSRFSWVP